MKIKAKIDINYKKSEYAQIAYKSLKPDNNGFVESSINKNTINFNIQSNNLGSFLNTADDLIFCETTVEKILNKTK